MGVMIGAASDKFILTLMSALLLTGAMGGNYTPTEEQINIYDYKMGQIDDKMKVVMEDPTEANIHAVYYDLMGEMQWSERHVSDRSLEYEAYLESCNDILINLSKEKYVTESHEINEPIIKLEVSHPFLWLVNVPEISHYA